MQHWLALCLQSTLSSIWYFWRDHYTPEPNITVAGTLEKGRETAWSAASLMGSYISVWLYQGETQMPYAVGDSGIARVICFFFSSILLPWNSPIREQPRCRSRLWPSQCQKLINELKVLYKLIKLTNNQLVRNVCCKFLSHFPRIRGHRYGSNH